MRKLVVVLMLVAFLSVTTVGCFKHTYTVGKGGDNGKDVYSEWHAHWLFGIIGDENVNLKKYCPSGNATIKEQITFVNGLIGALIGLIYYPTTVKIECKMGGRAAIELTPQQMAQIALDANFLDFVEDVNPALLPDARLAQQSAKLFLDGYTLAMK